MGFGLLFGMGTLGFRFLQFLVPNRKDRQAGTVLIGAESKMAAIVQKNDLALTHKILVLRSNEGIIAFSRRCTDLGCLVSWNKEREQFVCPCHQGTFDKTGLNIAGPPPRPLDRFNIIKRGEQLYVNIQNA